MFSRAATKIAHNSTIPALAMGGNQDLRPLQDLISAEKGVLTSLQRLSADIMKAAEALRIWGMGEGEDLGDTLTASTTLLSGIANALYAYGKHHTGMRDLLKTIRSREEALDELRRRRRSVMAKADSAEKKLAKMGPEHKNAGVQTGVLHELKAEIRTLDRDILVEEGSLSDAKRVLTRTWMGMKFGGLAECCEKGAIAADYGKMLIVEISEEPTTLGLPRPVYYGHAQTAAILQSAAREIEEIKFSPTPTPSRSNNNNRTRIYNNDPSPYADPPQQRSEDSGSATWEGSLEDAPPPTYVLPAVPQGLSAFFDSNSALPLPPPTESSASLTSVPPPQSPPASTTATFYDRDRGLQQQQPTSPRNFTPSSEVQFDPSRSDTSREFSTGAAAATLAAGVVDDFGVPLGGPSTPMSSNNNTITYNSVSNTGTGTSVNSNTSATSAAMPANGLIDTSKAGGGRFATFPVRRLNIVHNTANTSAAAAATNAVPPLPPAPAFLTPAEDSPTFRFSYLQDEINPGTPPYFSPPATDLPAKSRDFDSAARADNASPPPPFVEQQQSDVMSPGPYTGYETQQQQQPSYTSYAPQPPEDSDPERRSSAELHHPWELVTPFSSAAATTSTSTAPASFSSTSPTRSKYPSNDGDKPETSLVPPTYPSNSLAEPSDDEANDGNRSRAGSFKQVRFGDVSDLEDTEEKYVPRHHEKFERKERRGKSPSPAPPANRGGARSPPGPTPLAQPALILNTEFAASKESVASSTGGSGRSKRVPPPVWDPLDEERELNAAAARELSRELSALTFNPHSPLVVNYPAYATDLPTPRASGFNQQQKQMSYTDADYSKPAPLKIGGGGTTARGRAPPQPPPQPQPQPSPPLTPAQAYARAVSSPTAASFGSSVYSNSPTSPNTPQYTRPPPVAVARDPSPRPPDGPTSPPPAKGPPSNFNAPLPPPPPPPLPAPVPTATTTTTTATATTNQPSTPPPSQFRTGPASPSQNDFNRTAAAAAATSPPKFNKPPGSPTGAALPPGQKTISAAAFRRPGGRPIGASLPSSPYPLKKGSVSSMAPSNSSSASGLSNAAAAAPLAAAAAARPSQMTLDNAGPGPGPGSGFGQSPPPHSSGFDRGAFVAGAGAGAGPSPPQSLVAPAGGIRPQSNVSDYIDTYYLDYGPPSPSPGPGPGPGLGVGYGTNQNQTRGPRSRSPSPGYQQGRYATKLGNDSML